MNAARDAALAVFDAMNRRDLSVLDEVMTADYVDHGSPFPLPPGPEGARMILGFVTEVLQLRYEIEDVFDTEDRVVVRATGHGVGLDAMHGPGSEGKPFVMQTVHIYRTEGDRLAEHWGIRDEYGARIQLGTVAAPDPAAFAAAVGAR